MDSSRSPGQFSPARSHRPQPHRRDVDVGEKPMGNPEKDLEMLGFPDVCLHEMARF